MNIRRSSKFPPTLSSKNCAVLHFTLKPVVHVESIVVKGERSVSNFPFLTRGRLVVPAPFVERTVFAPLYCFCSLPKTS